MDGRYSQQLVKNCVNSSDIVLFTAAPPGQGGIGHINLRPPTFWIDLFYKQRYFLDEQNTKEVKMKFTKLQVVPWLINNFMCFKKIKN